MSVVHSPAIDGLGSRASLAMKKELIRNFRSFIQSEIENPQWRSLNSQFFCRNLDRITIFIRECRIYAQCRLRSVVGLEIVLCDQRVKPGRRRSTLRHHNCGCVCL